jgi:DNA-binding beta-propeller fold protein YncE
VKVNGTSSTTVYATGTDATSLVPIDTTSNAAGTAVTIPTITPTGGTATQPTLNSAVINPQGDKIFIGTNLGLLVYTIASNTFGTPNTSVPGKVLSVSPDGTKVLISDVPNSKLYVFDNATLGIQTFSLAGATNADWTPDSMKAFVTAGTNLFVYSSAIAPRTVALSATANEVAVLPQGTLGYLGGANSLQVLAVCTNNTVASIPLSGTPALIEAALNGSRVFAVDTTSIHRVNVSLPGQGCPPTVFTNTATSFNFGVGSFTPKKLIVLPDGSRAYVTSSASGVLALDANAGTTTTIPLTGGGVPTTGGVTSDGASIYVGATTTNNVQKIDSATNTVTAQIAVNLKKADGTTAAVPDLVVVKP